MKDLYDGKIVKSLKPSDFDFNIYNKTAKVKLPSGYIVFYAPWCGHCANPDFIEMWTKMSKVYAKHGLMAASYNCYRNGNEEFANQLGIRGYPTIKFVNSDGKLEDYEGSRDMISLGEYLVKNIHRS